ncbi:flavanone 7-O-glucoside 2''-O-beta-L-rhamnosyltransferase [Tripterygium wilfordii]|uniref:Glycosyltransferase n=1 Tax=Tripterygium wilfordii TaxID=458696 RepID=A0A7J7DEU2_TRIWF|nr:flavanone 7-O-glucoside 2''-O-beta-L-rhamnosyltransferase-like [Tripterygium wilfordii]KAF5744821.1 flavanone 7-O-glucoside 2''-O-beta-L-rhamnosyltransferase [Tripterygium wilfordii]
MDPKLQKTSVLMLPWLAHGHISPFFELAKKLSQYNFHIYFCSTPINLKPLRENPFPNKNKIQLIDLHLPSSLLPPHYHTTKDLPPHLMSTLKTAFDESKPVFCDVLKTLEPDILIYDFLQPWAPAAAIELNIRAVMFLLTGGATTSFLMHHCINPGVEFPFPEFRFPEAEVMKFINFMFDTANGITNGDRYFKCLERSNNMVLVKTSREIEAKYIDYCSVLTKKEMVSVGALVQEPEVKVDDTRTLNWLKKKEPSSVVFVSFGSEYFLSKKEMNEIALGLELSEVSFIWVVRFHGEGRDCRSIEEALPDGFLKRIGERGLIVENWAPQLKILEHPSIGGFVSHCGWSSTMEGMMFGVPIIAMPMQLDQPLNARLVVKFGVGIEVPRESGRIFQKEEMARVIKQVVMEEEGKEVRKKAKEVSQKMREIGDAEMDMIVEKLLLLLI